MQAVILAGGVGSRLAAMTDGKPKCLVEIGGRPLILHQLEHLADHGVGPVLVVLGYQAEEVRKVIGDRAESIVNERYDDTNSLYSLWLARDWIKGPFVLANSDLFFDPRVLDRILEEAGNVLAYDSTSSRGREQTKVVIKQRRVLDIGKDLPASSARGESLGLLKFDETGASAMLEAANDLIREGYEKAWVIEATRAVCSQHSMYGINVAGLPWTEIDFPYDLDVARREVWPEIWKSRWRSVVYWKRTRWAVAAAVALVLGFTGWIAGARTAPVSTDWDTVPHDSGERIRIERNDKTQRWWMGELDEVVSATVNGTQALVELRLVIPDSSLGDHRYVVEISLDGEAYDWEALTSTIDTTAHFGDWVIGDRDRIRIPLSTGDHTVGVKLTDGHANQILVRIRQPEEDVDN